MKAKNFQTLTLIVALFIGCKFVPINVAHFSAGETFEHVLEYGGDNNQDLTRYLKLLLSGKPSNSIDRVDCFLGTNITDHLESGLKNKQITSIGNVVFTLSMAPQKKPKAFFISGGGKYIIYDKRNLGIYFTGVFGIEERRIPLSILEESNASIPVYFDQILMNHIPCPEDTIFNRFAHFPVEKLKVDIKLDRKHWENSRKRIFLVDRMAEHEVSIKGEKIGYIKFKPSEESIHDKIIDLSKMRYIKIDYSN